MVKFGIEAINSPTHLKDGEDASGYFSFGAIAVLSAALDLRLVIGGIGNKHRIARHLWRMNLAMAIGIISVTPRLNRLAGHPTQSDALLVAPTLTLELSMLAPALSQRSRSTILSVSKLRQTKSRKFANGLSGPSRKITGKCFDEETKKYSFEALADVDSLLLGMKMLIASGTLEKVTITDFDRSLLLLSDLVDEYQFAPCRSNDDGQ